MASFLALLFCFRFELMRFFLKAVTKYTRFKGHIRCCFFGKGGGGGGGEKGKRIPDSFQANFTEIFRRET